MEEDREKQLAEELARMLDGETVDENPDRVLEDETALLISGAFGNGPELNKEFDSTLRARLVREAGKNKTTPVRRFKWMQYAVAACILIFIAPTLWMMKDRQYQQKVELVEKYDKMYVPYTEQIKDDGSTGYSQELFSESHLEKVREMSRKAAAARRKSMISNFRYERRDR